jgi:hypothetical protein
MYKQAFFIAIDNSGRRYPRESGATDLACATDYAFRGEIVMEITRFILVVVSFALLIGTLILIIVWRLSRLI